ncbi:flagellar hook-associated protein FlgK [Marivita hallyeonensis]|uniref:Flagellar hook-associated protein 1 n=1 Tax=Marivita hallyeonensis TaxID=996342 RepID=A0A1M5UPF1_9RHOB|nr:flagellar hook-associated protein FlgK [Marivita hallyeonensis]SHH64855.1 flagellar hook-associated protein 1 FlgK [Marivita hallyeonensis]
MSLSGALSNAMSGLTANARATIVVSSNIANALNETYGRREVVVATDGTSSWGGVRIASIDRHSDPVLSHQARNAMASASAASIHAGFATKAEALIGSVDTPSSIAARLTDFEAALLSASSDPSSGTRLRTVGQKADALASSFRSASAGIQNLREQAEREIEAAVSDINASLLRLEELNDHIVGARHLGLDTLNQQDERDAVLDKLAAFFPLHVIARESGAVSIFTGQGRTLLDGKAVQLEFDRKPSVEPHMTMGNGLLSGIRIGDDWIDPGNGGMLSGGALAAHFETRDMDAVRLQVQLDGIARDVVERFGPGGPDTTLSMGDSGVFTDAGNAFVAADEVGLAGRLELNSVLDGTSPEIWRWRHGINALTPTDAGASDLLRALSQQLTNQALPNSAALEPSPKSFVDHIHGLSADLASQRVWATDASAFATDRLNGFENLQASDGVNTDEELQRLIELEKSYAANARVIRVVDDMLSELLKM